MQTAQNNGLVHIRGEMISNEIANVSVIIPCYCCVATVGRALRSVARQTMAPAEIILVDDASNDGGATLSCLRRLIDQFSGMTEIPIRLIALQNNSGPSGARNSAWDIAIAEFVAFLDADDAWHPKKIEIQYSWMQAHPEATLSGHRSDQINGLMPISEITSRWCVKKYGFRSMLFKNSLQTRTVMMRRDTPFRFADGKCYAEDYFLWLQLMASGERQIFIIGAVLAYSFKSSYGENGLSGDLWCMECGELDNFYRLYKDKDIGWCMYLAVSAFSFLKYLKRVAIVACRYNISLRLL